jgi:hypothetical protein
MKIELEDEKKKFDSHKQSYQGKDSREGRLHEVKTDRGTFRHKDNRKGDD